MSVPQTVHAELVEAQVTHTALRQAQGERSILLWP
jgi:hypothetical protein